MFDVGEFLRRTGLPCRSSNAVVVLPLEEADPDDDAGDLVGVEVDFDAEELRRVRHGVEGEGEAVEEAEVRACCQRSRSRLRAT